MKQNESKLTEWSALLEERKQKGLTIKEFCKEKNITLSQFYYYQECINKPKESEQKTNVSNVQPIKIVNTSEKENAVIRFIFPNNLQCILPRDMSLQEIKAILELAMSC